MADVIIQAKAYRYSSSFLAGTVVSYKLVGSGDYLAILNTGTADLEVALGEDGTLPDASAYFILKPDGFYEPSSNFFQREEIVLYIKGSTSFHIIR